MDPYNAFEEWLMSLEPQTLTEELKLEILEEARTLINW
jgi:hypothetical protein